MHERKFQLHDSFIRSFVLNKYLTAIVIIKNKQHIYKISISRSAQIWIRSCVCKNFTCFENKLEIIMLNVVFTIKRYWQFEILTPSYNQFRPLLLSGTLVLVSAMFLRIYIYVQINTNYVYASFQIFLSCVFRGFLDYLIWNRRINMRTCNVLHRLVEIYKFIFVLND